MIQSIDALARQGRGQLRANCVLAVAFIAAIFGAGQPAVWIGMLLAFCISMSGLWTARVQHVPESERVEIAKRLKGASIAYASTMSFSFGSIAAVWRPSWGTLPLLFFLQVLPWFHYAVIRRLLLGMELELERIKFQSGVSAEQASAHLISSTESE